MPRKITSSPVASSSAASPGSESEHATPPSTGAPGSSATRSRSRGSGGVLSGLNRALRATSKTVAFPFYTKTSTTPTRAKPEPKVVRVEAPRPRRMGQLPSLGHKHERNIDAIVPQAKSISARAEVRFGLPEDMRTPEGAKRYIGTQWRQVETDGQFTAADIDRLASMISERLLSIDNVVATQSAHQLETPAGAAADGGQQAASHAILVSDALAQATGGDPVRARAALEALLDNTQHESPRVRADVFALQIALGATGIGMETLLAIAPHVLHDHGAAGDANASEILREAFRHGLRAADQLLRNKPADEAGPASLEELAALADKALPVAERVRTDSVSDIAAEPAASEVTPAWLANPANTLAIKALQAANVLRANPAANCPPHQAAAYMAWRNGFDREGPGTDLANTQQRFFKLFTYAERAARTGIARRAVSGFLGKQKSPLSALQNFGTAGMLLGHPEQEFAHFTGALAPVKERLVEGLKSPATSHESKIRFAVRLAALEQWEQRMATKGLRSKFKFSSSDRKAIEVRARAALPSQPARDRENDVPAPNLEGHMLDFNHNRDRNIAAISAEVKALDKMSPAQLETWAAESWGASEQVPASVTEKIDVFRTRLAGGDIRPQRGEANTQLDAINDLVRQMPDAYDIRFSSGGMFGLASIPSESLTAFSHHLGVPHVSVLPDVGYIRGRHAVIDVGSNSHFGHVFIGSDSRNSLYGGLGGFAGWSFGKKHKPVFSVGGSLGLRRSYDTGDARGVTIRTRRSDNEQAGSPDAWRSTMHDVLNTARRAGPNDEAPRNAEEMWGGLTQRFWKDPAVSINWTDSRNKTHATTATAGITARIGTSRTPSTSWGPSLGASLRKVSKALSRTKDIAGTHAINVATNNSGRGVSVSATLVEGLPSASMPHHSGHLATLSFPSQPYFGVGTTLLSTNTNAALRIGREGDRTVGKHTYKDTEFGTFDELKQYVDTHRAEWMTSLGGDAAARDKLDKWMAQVKEGATAGNLVMGERLDMHEGAARNLDFLMHRKQRLERLTKPTPAQARELARIDTDIRKVLGNENSWRRQSLYVLEALGTQRTVGLSFMLNAQSAQSVAGVREMAVLSAAKEPEANRT